MVNLTYGNYHDRPCLVFAITAGQAIHRCNGIAFGDTFYMAVIEKGKNICRVIDIFNSFYSGNLLDTRELVFLRHAGGRIFDRAGMARCL